MSGEAELNEMINSLREIGDLAENAAPRAAEKLDAVLRANIAAGVGPNGAQLQPTKKGKQPLQSAGRALSVTSAGTLIEASIGFPFSLHHLGQARGGVKRPLLPTEEMPDPVAEAIRQSLEETFDGG